MTDRESEAVIALVLRTIRKCVDYRSCPALPTAGELVKTFAAEDAQRAAEAKEKAAKAGGN